MTDTLRERLQTSVGTAFRIDRELEGGGMARLFLAHDPALDRTVVVKVLDGERDVDSDRAERFRREVKVIARLQHPHIVPVHAAGGTGPLLWYAMPYVAGETLRARLDRDGALPITDAVRIAHELLEALGHAHAQGIVHRDVKPENILLESGHAVVADFGVAKALADAGISSRLTNAGIALGTPAYMAPEQATADPGVDHRADLYATGAVLYEMLTGTPPYSGSAQSVIAAHLTAPVPRVREHRRDVPTSVATVAERLMAKSPDERPQRAADAIALLDGPGAAQSSRRGMLGAAVIAIALTSGSLWWRDRADPTPVADAADIIAVMPLGSTGDSALSRLGRDLVVTVSANLDGVGSLRAVDAMSILQRAQTLPHPIPLAEARSLAADLGARSVLHGSLVHDGDSVRADVALYPVDGGDPIARYSLRGPVDGIQTLTDSLTTEVLRQVWRRGRAPTPFLADVTTASNEALRAFLAAEELFRRFDADAAVHEYARAIAFDSTFAQAALRLDYVRGMALMPADTANRRRLMALRHRLPARDRELLELRAATGIGMRRRIDSGRVLAARYPDYHTAQYQVGDNIIHYGPAMGVPLREALPYLDRLDALAPNLSDNAFHQMMVAPLLGDTARYVRGLDDMIRLGVGPPRARAVIERDILNAARAGRTRHLEDALPLARELAELPRVSAAFRWAPAPYLLSGHTAAAHDQWLTMLRREPAYADLLQPIRLMEGLLRASRGDFARGVRALGDLTGSDAPAEVRLSAVRNAAFGAWLGALSAGDADTALDHTRRAIGVLSGLNAAELEWSEGVIGIAAADSARVWRAARAIADTMSQNAPLLRRSLFALWRERRVGLIDSLRALEDEMMERSITFAPALPIHRAALGRALVRAGDAAAAEHYLQWSDGSDPALRRSLVDGVARGYNSYERGIALEAAGDPVQAIMHLQRFVNSVDLPAEAIRSQVDDAKARLGRLLARRR